MYIPAAHGSVYQGSRLLDRAREAYPTRLTHAQIGMDGAVYEASTFFINNSSSSNFDFYCGRINQSAAFINALSLLSTFVPVLRSFTAGGIRLLSSAKVSALLLFTGSQALYQQAPHAGSALRNIFSRRESSWKDYLELSSFAVGSLATLVGAGSFVVGAKGYFFWRKSFQTEGVIPSIAHEKAWLRADAARRAFHDPQIWQQFAREYPDLSRTSRFLIFQSGQWTNRILLGGSAVLGLTRLGFTSHEYSELSALGVNISWRDWSALFMQSLLEFGPGMTVALYRGSRGDYRYGVGVPPSQKFSEAVLQSHEHRVTLLERVRRTFTKLSPAQERSFLVNGENKLNVQEALLNRAEDLVLPRREERVNLPPHPALPLETPAIPPLRLGMEDYTAYKITDFIEAFQSKTFTPTQLFREILKHPEMENGCLFPRDLRRGTLGRRLRRLVRESERRYQEGTARPLEGIPVIVKDLLPGIDGVMHAGSKTSRLTMPQRSPVIDILLEMGAIPIPGGMVAAGNGGTSFNIGFGKLGHPTRPGYDSAGSSSAEAYVVGLKSLPIQLGIGSDTGGSVTAPAGAVGVFGFVPPRGVISTKNMAAFATFLDRIGAISLHASDGMNLASLLARRIGDDHLMTHSNPGLLFSPSARRPRIYFLTELLQQASQQAQQHFLAQMRRLHDQGYEVMALNSDWNFLSQVPMELYPFDAYPAAAGIHTNPLQRNCFDPPRISLDHNMRVRMPKAALSLEHGFFDRARQLSKQYASLVNRLFGEHSILASPSAEAIRTADIEAGIADKSLDGHDFITMNKNRVDSWGQVNLPADPHAEVGVVFSGALPNLTRVLQDSGIIN